MKLIQRKRKKVVKSTPQSLKKDRARKKKERERNIKFICKHLHEHPCVDCGEKDILVLDFDHVDTKTKSKEISAMLNDRSSIKNIKKELENCVVRCAHCHRRRTAKQQKWGKLKYVNKKSLDVLHFD